MNGCAKAQPQSNVVRFVIGYEYLVGDTGSALRHVVEAGYPNCPGMQKQYECAENAI